MFSINTKAMLEYVVGDEMLNMLTYGKLRGQYGQRGNYITDEHIWTQQMEDQWNKVFEDNVVDKSTLTVFVSLVVELTLKYTPIDTGHLVKTLFIKDYINRDEDKAVAIGFDCDYAKFVHEIPFYHHEFPTRYKFLETAALETIQRFGSIYPVTITYSPLCVYINDETRGENISAIQEYRKKLKEGKTEIYKQFIREFEKYEQDRKPENLPSVNALIFGRYMKYWNSSDSKINVAPSELIDNFITDRQRHSFNNRWTNTSFTDWLNSPDNSGFESLMNDWRTYLM